MDLVLVERFLQAMVPPSGNSAVNVAFMAMRANPAASVPSVTMMIARFQHLLASEFEKDQADATFLVLVGVMIAWSSEDATLKECILKNYVEQAAKLRGENVIHFFDQKAGK